MPLSLPVVLALTIRRTSASSPTKTKSSTASAATSSSSTKSKTAPAASTATRWDQSRSPSVLRHSPPPLPLPSASHHQPNHGTSLHSWSQPRSHAQRDGTVEQLFYSLLHPYMLAFCRRETFTLPTTTSLDIKFLQDNIFFSHHSPCVSNVHHLHHQNTLSHTLMSTLIPTTPPNNPPNSTKPHPPLDTGTKSQKQSLPQARAPAALGLLQVPRHRALPAVPALRAPGPQQRPLLRLVRR